MTTAPEPAHKRERVLLWVVGGAAFAVALAVGAALTVNVTVVVVTAVQESQKKRAVRDRRTRQRVGLGEPAAGPPQPLAARSRRR